MVVVTVAALVIGAALIAVALPKADAGDGELHLSPISYPAELIKGATVGSPDAPVVMELYADFQCPACRIFVTQQLGFLVNDYVAKGTLRIETRDIAFLGRGTEDESLALAVGAGCAAEQGRYWQYHDLVFWNQGRENRGDHSDGFIRRVGAAAGVEPTAFATCRERADVATSVTDLTRQAIAAGINRTPTLVVNGQKLVGVPDYAELSTLIQQLASPSSPGPSSAPSAPASPS